MRTGVLAAAGSGTKTKDEEILRWHLRHIRFGRTASRPLALACAAGPAHGADQALPNVTVSAGRGSSLQDMDVSTTVMTRDQIEQAPQTTLDQLVGRIPGAFVLQQPAGQLHPTAQVFSIRGFGTTTNVNTLLMIDGVQPARTRWTT